MQHTSIIVLMAFIGISGGIALISGAQSKEESPQQVVEHFTRAVIGNDISTIGQLSGMDTSRGAALEQFWGKALATQAAAIAQNKANDPADYKIQSKLIKSSAQSAQVQLDIFAKDMVSVARQAMIFMGYKPTEDGRLIIPPSKEPEMSVDEAIKKAESEYTYPPFHYKFTISLVNKGGKWIVVNNNSLKALVSIVKFTNYSKYHDQYLVR